MKHIYTSILFLIGLNTLNAQIGINTNTPHKNTDLHLGSKNKAILLNHVNDFEFIDDPQNGMLVYDEIKKCFKGYANGKWSDCFGSGSVATSVPVVDATGPGFNDSYNYGENLVNATYSITITNNSFSSATISLAKSDLELSDSQINVSSVSPTSITLNAGDEKVITYTLTGKPSRLGKLVGTWKKITLSFVDTTEIISGCLPGSWNESITPSVQNGFKKGINYTGIYKIPFSGAAEITFPAENISSNGLTLQTNGADHIDEGELIYTLSGTYTGNDGASITFLTTSGCAITAGDFPESCKKIKEIYPNSAWGVYQIDPDGKGDKYGIIDVNCDMETDGGGWTLILNYNHTAGTNPNLNIRTQNLPLIGSTTSYINESGTKNWGHASNSLLKDMEFTELRYYSKTADHNRIIHFKTKLGSVITYIKTGKGSMNGIQSNFTPLTGHNANLPGNAINFYNGQGDLALTNFPFYFTMTRAPYSHFSIKGGGLRWESDNYKDIVSTSSLNTYYQA